MMLAYYDLCLSSGDQDGNFSRRRSHRLSMIEGKRRRSAAFSHPAAVKTYGDDEADVLIDSTLKVPNRWQLCVAHYLHHLLLVLLGTGAPYQSSIICPLRLPLHLFRIIFSSQNTI